MAGTGQIMRSIIADPSAEQFHTQSEEKNQRTLASILRVIGPLDNLSLDTAPTRESPSHDWSDLIEKVREAANRVRQAEADSQEQELRVREVLERVREDMKVANERAIAAEVNARDVQLKTDALLKAASARVEAAENRARIAEEWLAKVSQAIVEEFDRAGSQP